MAKKLHLIGLRIVGDTRLASKTKTFHIQVDYGSPAEALFLTSPRLRKILMETPNDQLERFNTLSRGHIELVKAEYDKVLVKKYYPFGGDTFLRPDVLSQLQHTGKAAQIEKKIYQAIKNWIAARKIVGDNLLPRRLLQLKKRGVQMKKGRLGFESYSTSAQNMIRLINTQHRKEKRERQIARRTPIRH